MATATKKVTPEEIVDIYNMNGQDSGKVAVFYNWPAGYAKFMVEQALKKVSNIASNNAVNVPATSTVEEVEEAPKEDAPVELTPVQVTCVDEEDVGESVEEVSLSKEEKPLSMLRTIVDKETMTPQKSSSYIMREVDKLVKTFASLGRNICLIGDSGTGKTTLVEQYAADSKLPFLRVSCDETSSLKMLLGTKEILNGTTYFKGGILLELVQMPSVILFDEFNALHSSKLFFLHELLDNRRLFVPDADGGKVIKIHPKCQLFLACNPSNKNYGGTNKMNAALGNRTTVIDLANIDVEEMAALFECGQHTNSMKTFYSEAQRAISDKQLKVAFSLRNIQRASEAIKHGVKPFLAMKYEFYNAALLTASEVERDVFEGIALRIFGR
jgi:MoxR-like ATPase